MKLLFAISGKLNSIARIRVKIDFGEFNAEVFSGVSGIIVAYLPSINTGRQMGASLPKCRKSVAITLSNIPRSRGSSSLPILTQNPLPSTGVAPSG